MPIFTIVSIAYTVYIVNCSFSLVFIPIYLLLAARWFREEHVKHI